MFFADNIKLLRKRKGRIQDEVAINLNMKRSTLSGYENGIAQPNMDALIAFSNFYKMSVDTLIKQDLSKVSQKQLLEMEMGNDPFITGTNLRVLATTVGADNEENIELVPVKAKAGYTNGFSDPEFIENLPAFRMPMLRTDRKYRTFPISGDSMLPIPDGSWVTGEYVDDWRNLKIGEAYIFVTSSEGIVFKILDGKQSDGRVLELKSLNPLYKNYEVPIDEMKEVWHFVHYISEEIPEPQLSKDGMMSGLLALQEQMQMVTKKLNLN